MKKMALIFLLTVGCANLHAQLFSISPSIGFSKSIIRFDKTNAPSLGKIVRERDGINKSFTFGLLLDYLPQKKLGFVAGYNYLECGFGWYIKPINGNFTYVSGYLGARLNQYFLGCNYKINLIFESKTDKIEKKNGWRYDDGENWLRLNLGFGPSLNRMNIPVYNLKSGFGPVPAFNIDNPDFAWMLGYEKPRYVHKTSMGLWFRTGLTFVKKGNDKLSLDFVMNIGLQDKYIIETNNKYGNTRTGQLLKEEQFNVVSKGTSMALMLSYPIYFGKRK